MNSFDNTEPPVIAPSVLSADFTNIQREIDRATEAGADWIHIDPMDGHFVDNLTLGPFIVEAIRRTTDLPLDVHLMLEHPDSYLDDFISAGADLISFHIESRFPAADRIRKEEGWTLVSEPEHRQEAYENVTRLVNRCHQTDTKAGIVLNPSTPASAVEPVLDPVDLVLVMTVWPGFGGQSFMYEPLKKVEQLAEASVEGDLLIEVDGGVSPDTIGDAAEAGADVFVAGSSTFGADQMSEAIQDMRNIAQSSLDSTR